MSTTATNQTDEQQPPAQVSPFDSGDLLIAPNGNEYRVRRIYRDSHGSIRLVMYSFDRRGSMYPLHQRMLRSIEDDEWEYIPNEDTVEYGVWRRQQRFGTREEDDE
jgi:hypothetical protein